MNEAIERARIAYKEHKEAIASKQISRIIAAGAEWANAYNHLMSEAKWTRTKVWAVIVDGKAA